MAALGYKNLNNKIDFNCGGSLISEQHVITAAHCSNSNGLIPSIVRLGDLNLKMTEEYLPENDVPIAKFISHEKYLSNEKKYDIAIINLVKKVTFSKYIRPACLSTSEMLIENSKAIATGWGLTEALTTRTSNNLKKVELSIIDNNTCQQIYNDTKIDESKLCAGELEGGKDTCQGDSGGPIQVFLGKGKCVFVLIGITSYGDILCGFKNSPGIYTKVSYHIDWIEKIVWGSQ
ncbi:serine protease snake-like [Chironomus tepperi]|uniref:serine protease snake-like n=1 Tax=Chironomus tepperi TaxID=113505 RepID=UPI00391F7E63